MTTRTMQPRDIETLEEQLAGMLEKLEDLDDHVTQINVKLAVLADREPRELVMAKSMSMKVAATIGTIVSAIVAGLVGAFGDK